MSLFQFVFLIDCLASAHLIRVSFQPSHLPIQLQFFLLFTIYELLYMLELILQPLVFFEFAFDFQDVVLFDRREYEVLDKALNRPSAYQKAFVAFLGSAGVKQLVELTIELLLLILVEDCLGVGPESLPVFRGELSGFTLDHLEEYLHGVLIHGGNAASPTFYSTIFLMMRFLCTSPSLRLRTV